MEQNSQFLEHTFILQPKISSQENATQGYLYHAKTKVLKIQGFFHIPLYRDYKFCFSKMLGLGQLLHNSHSWVHSSLSSHFYILRH